MNLESTAIVIADLYDEYMMSSKVANIENPLKRKNEMLDLCREAEWTAVEAKFEEVRECHRHIGKVTIIPPMLNTMLDLLKSYSESNPVLNEENDNNEIKWIMPILKDIAVSSEEECIYYQLKQNISYESAKEVMKKIYNETGKIMFVESPNVKLDGRVIACFGTNTTPIELATVTAKKVKDMEEYYELCLFDEQIHSKAKTESVFVKDFYIYSFEAGNKKYSLLSQEPLQSIRCTIKGMRASITDKKRIGEDVKLPTKTEIIIVKSAEPYYTEHTAESVKTMTAGWTHDTIASKMFGLYRHPEWFEKLMIAQMFSYREYGYPVHLFMIAQEGTGKSILLENMMSCVGESIKHFSAGVGTVKGLIPSFRESPPDEGALTKFDRVGTLDEFLDIVRNNGKDQSASQYDDMRKLNDYLEHKEITASGAGTPITSRISCRLIAAANYIRGVKNIVHLSEKIDKALLSRFVIYFQNKNHIDFIQSNQIEKKIEVPESKEIIELMDYYTMQDALDVDNARVVKLIDELVETVPASVVSTVKARYRHHIKTLLQGIARYHSIVDGRDEVSIIDKDYDEVASIMHTIISSWTENINIKNVPVRARINLLESKHKEVYDIILETQRLSIKDIQACVDYPDDVDYIVHELSAWELLTYYMDSDDTQRYVTYWYTAHQQQELPVKNKLPIEQPKLKVETQSLDEKVEELKDATEYSHNDLVDKLSSGEIALALKEGLIYESRPGNYKKI